MPELTVSTQPSPRSPSTLACPPSSKPCTPPAFGVAGQALVRIWGAAVRRRVPALYTPMRDQASCYYLSPYLYLYLYLYLSQPWEP